MNIVKALPPNFPDNTYVAVDSGWLQLNSKQMHRPNSGKFACLTLCSAVDPDTVYFIDKDKDVQSALNIIDNCVWIGQYFKFDIVQLRRHATIPPRSKLIDLYLMEKILYGGYYDRFSLKDLARRYLGIILDKEARELFETAETMTDEMIEYECRDAQVQLLVWQEQKKNVTKTDMKIWREVDAPAMWAFADFKGFRINSEEWIELAKRNKERQETIDAELPFNPRSPKQVSKYFGTLNAQEKTLQKFINKSSDENKIETAKKCLESKKYGKRASTYGLNFIENYLEKENDYDVIVADYDVIGAETGRTSSSSPNFQNIIARDTDEFRDCFIARPEHKLVIADYDAQESRITAYLTRDTKLIKIFESGEKVYVAIAREIFGKKVRKGSPEYSKAKSTILGVDYGMSAWGLATRENMTKEEADELLVKFFRLFPGIQQWVNQQIENKKVVKTVIGRKVWLNPYSNQVERNALNAPHQGSAADMMKKALGIIHSNWGFPFDFCCVGYIHDELIFDVPEQYANDVAKVVKYVMEQVGNEMCSPIPFKADIVITDKWSGKE